MTSFHIQTFGCKSNQYESQAMRETLIASGLVPAAGSGDADVYIVNTCGVTGRAGASCRNAIRKNLRANPGARLVVTGCGVDLGDNYAGLPGQVPLLVPNAKKYALPQLLALDNPGPDDVVAALDDRFALSISRFHDHTRAFLKIQDGCANFCAYCAVPFARGRPESRPPAAIREEAARLVEHGHAEIVVTGINIGAYRHGGYALPDIVAALAATPGLVRLRLGSVEPPHATRELVDAMAASVRVCHHLHLPLQSGDDAILAAMGRRYAAGEFLDRVEMLRQRLDHPAISTDVIVGFPGETREAAAASRDLCRRAGFSRLHVFPFSARPGTRAAAMRRTVFEPEIEERKNALLSLGRELSAKFAASCVGMRERVIMENAASGLSDRYVRTRLDAPVAAGRAAAVRIAGADGADLRGTVCAD